MFLELTFLLLFIVLVFLIFKATNYQTNIKVIMTILFIIILIELYFFFKFDNIVYNGIQKLQQDIGNKTTGEIMSSLFDQTPNELIQNIQRLATPPELINQVYENDFKNIVTTGQQNYYTPSNNSPTPFTVYEMNRIMNSPVYSPQANTIRNLVLQSTYYQNQPNYVAILYYFQHYFDLLENISIDKNFIRNKINNTLTILSENNVDPKFIKWIEDINGIDKQFVRDPQMHEQISAFQNVISKLNLSSTALKPPPSQ